MGKCTEVLLTLFALGMSYLQLLVIPPLMIGMTMLTCCFDTTGLDMRCHKPTHRRAIFMFNPTSNAYRARTICRTGQHPNQFMNHRRLAYQLIDPSP